MRFFTPDEANAALPEVRPLVERLVDARAVSSRLEERLGGVRERVVGNGGGLDPGQVGELHTRATAAAREVLALVEALDELGIQVKDADTGLVDFPARHPDGSEVLLCWRLGEEEVAFWHTTDAGFAGRKALPF